ncbi:MAG: YHS domain-containing (seleno)protein [Aestuariibacter sp.]
MNLVRKLLLALALISSPSVFADDPVNSSLFGNIAIDGYDSVAYWTESKAIEGEKKYTFEWQGAKWRFANQENLTLFKDNPEKYAPEYGGYCAWAMSDDRLAGIDGEAWTIYDGKLYLNYNMRVMDEWRQDKALFVEQADTFYQNRFGSQ